MRQVVRFGLVLVLLATAACSGGGSQPQDTGLPDNSESDSSGHSDTNPEILPDTTVKDGPTDDVDAETGDSKDSSDQQDLEVSDPPDVVDTLDLPDTDPGDADQADEAGGSDLDGDAGVPDVDSSGDAAEDTIVPPLCEEGQICDDGDPCTSDDWCDGGFCVGTPYVCDDGRWCTMDSCDGKGNCEFTLLIGKCMVNGVCAKTGDLKEGDQCRSCDPTKNAFEWTLKPFLPCNDGSKCTTDDKCVDGICAGTPVVCQDDGNQCTLNYCDPEYGCLQKPYNMACDDGNKCTVWDYCLSGECMGGPNIGCDDLNECTDDYCSPSLGCYHVKLDGTPCDDDNACTVDDECESGKCESGSEMLKCEDWTDCTDDICDESVGCLFPLNGNPCCINDINICDDKDPCTIDSCNVVTGACIYMPNVGACTDKNACTTNDTCVQGLCVGVEVNCDDSNPCTLDFCLPSSGCQHDALSGACDDNSVCTLNDWCINGKCQGAKVNCNDFNFCTDDLCDPATGCTHTYNTAPCNDYDLCTTSDKCVNGACTGTPKTCNDGNDCTADSCNPAVGCQNLFTVAPCNDNNDCTTNDHCEGGICIGGTVICASCNYDFSDAVNRAKTMKIAPDEKPENALDLNGDGVPDNSMAGIAGLANDPLQDSLDGGSVHLLFEHHGLKVDGNQYTMAVFIGEVAPGYETCDFTSQYCGYMADSSAIDTDKCESLVKFSNASIFQSTLVAGGPNATFPWSIPIAEGTVLNIVLYRATIKATVTIQGGVIVSMNGIIAGAIPKQSFIDAVNALPDEGLPFPKSMILQMVQALIQNDIDTDNNGSLDAASIAIQFQAIPGGILGMQ